MKNKIRFGVFETNSSSIHAISVNRGGGDIAAKSFADNHAGQVLHVEGDTFGWEFDTYCDPISKLSYILTLAASDGIDNYNKRVDFMKNILESTGFVVDFQKMVEHKSSDGKFSWVEPEDGTDIYIDHSDGWGGNFKEKIFSDKDFFLDFVFNNNSYILTGNDNSDWQEMDLGKTIDQYENDPDFYVKWN